MKLEAYQLAASVQKQWMPVYMVSGSEPLQQIEAVDLIRRKAREKGYLNREVLHVEGQFDWGQLPALCQSQSLFADKNLIELNLPTAKPGAQGSAMIVKVMDQLSEDNVIIIITGKLDKSSKNTKWYKAVNNAGVVVDVWPLEGQKLLTWLRERAIKKGLLLDNDGLKILLQRVEGNLLAVVQELDKLYAIYGAKQLSVDDIASSVEDNARFDVFKLTDGIMSGNVQRVSRVLNGLMAEKLAAPVVLWAITRELRMLETLSYAKSQSLSVEKVFQKNRVWDSKKSGYLNALSRGTLKHWQSLIKDCCDADMITKGAKEGSEWVVIEQVCLKACQPKSLEL